MKTIIIRENNVLVTYKLASFWLRLKARCIDTIIIFIPSSFIPIIASWLYWSLSHCSEGQATTGQWFSNIKLVALSGDKIGFGRATCRWLGNLLNIFTFFLGFLLFFFTSKKQCLHDLVTSTVVVETTPMQTKTTT